MILSTSLLLACGRPQYPDADNQGENTKVTAEAILPLEIIVNGIEMGKRIESAHLGPAGIASDQWKRYEQLQKAATRNQLTALTDHKNPAVRCYAFQALVQRHSENVFVVLMNHLKDTAIVETQSGCIVEECSVSGIFIDAVKYTNSLTFTKKEKIIIDSISTNRRSELFNPIIIKSKGKKH
jgi:hypothetical protein